MRRVFGSLRTVITFHQGIPGFRLEIFFSSLRADGIPVELESNGVIMPGGRIKVGIILGDSA